MHQFVLALHTSFCLCITCIMSLIAYHKNDLEILTIAKVFSLQIGPSDRKISHD